MLNSAAVSRLVLALLFVQAKQLHTKQAGKAGAAAPPTTRSGRVKKKQAAAATNNTQAHKLAVSMFVGGEV